MGQEYWIIGMLSFCRFVPTTHRLPPTASELRSHVRPCSSESPQKSTKHTKPELSEITTNHTDYANSKQQHIIPTFHHSNIPPFQHSTIPTFPHSPIPLPPIPLPAIPLPHSRAPSTHRFPLNCPLVDAAPQTSGYASSTHAVVLL